MWRDALLEEIRILKGDEVAKHFDAVLLPSILADFLKEIMKKGNAREDYNIDNGITLTLVGTKPARITEIYLNGKRVNF